MAAVTDIRAGQAWRYKSDGPSGLGRIVVGAVVEFDGQSPLVCCAVSTGPVADAEHAAAGSVIPFIPMTEAAFRATVLELAGEAELPDAFFDAFDAWRADPRGLTVFNVPFEGSLDRMIALQMADIAKVEI